VNEEFKISKNKMKNINLKTKKIKLQAELSQKHLNTQTLKLRRLQNGIHII